MTKTRVMTGRKTKKRKAASSGPKTNSSKLDQAVSLHAERILNGYILAIDPSSGSEKSQPGYAIYRAGKLVDYGLINIKWGDAVHNRLYRLATSLRGEFEQPDLLITEHLAPFMGEGKGAFFSTRNVISLHQSVGVIMSIWDVPVLTVSPRSWQAITPDNYQKSDQNDAIMLGWTVIHKASLSEVKVFPEMDREVVKLITHES